LKTNRLVAATLALVLIAGLGSPAFAQLVTMKSIESNKVFAPQHGNVDQSFTGPFDSVSGIEPQFIPSGQTFTPTTDNLVAVDVFFCDPTSFQSGSTDLTVNVWDSDTPGAGALLGSLTVNVDLIDIDCASQPDAVHFDFATIPLVPGDTYALSFVAEFTFIGVATNSFPDAYPGGVFWQVSPFPTVDAGFVTYFEDEPVVGGEFLPIETTSLLLAGAQTFSWMIPVILSGIGIGLFVVSRKSE